MLAMLHVHCDKVMKDNNKSQVYYAMQNKESNLNTNVLETHMIFTLWSHSEIATPVLLKNCLLQTIPILYLFWKILPGVCFGR